MDTLAIDTDGRAVDPRWCQPAELVEHAHTRAEHAVYTALWDWGGPTDPAAASRDVTVGYDKLARLVGGSKRNVQRIAEILQRKLAIKVVGAENSGLRQGKTYRVYSPPEILRRRREAGYLWRFRNRSAVAMVKMISIQEAAALANSSAGAAHNRPASSEHPPAPAPASALDKIRELLDDDQAAQKLIEECRALDRGTSAEEILYFLEREVAGLRRRPSIPHWREALLRAVARYFYGPTLELQKYRMEKRT